MNIGLFGGTFNPIHLGHLMLAEAAREQFALDRVVFIPTHQPPHKPAGNLLPGPIRLALIHLAIQDHPAFLTSDLELRRGGISYTIDTVRALRRRWPRARFFLMIGHDMLHATWKDWATLRRWCTVVVAQRPRIGGRTRAQGYRQIIMPLIDVSSSEIRQRLRQGRSIRYRVPRAVERYLRQHRLYRVRASRRSA